MAVCSLHGGLCFDCVGQAKHVEGKKEAALGAVNVTGGEWDALQCVM